MIDPTVPVHRQPTLLVSPGSITGCRHHHAWYHWFNGVVCAGAGGCGRLLVGITGKRGYRGRHRKLT